MHFLFFMTRITAYPSLPPGPFPNCLLALTAADTVPQGPSRASFVSLWRGSRAQSRHVSWALVSADKARARDRRFIQWPPVLFVLVVQQTIAHVLLTKEDRRCAQSR